MSSLKREIPTLTPLEQVGPRGYLRYSFPIALPQDYDLDETLRVLRAGWKATQERIPELACEVVPDAEAKQAGCVKLQKLKEGDFEPLVSKDLRDPSLFPETYAELKAKGFPLSAFKEDVIARRNTWPSAGEHLPVAAMQANFIRGGLILQCCFFHMLGDGKSFCTWTEVWADECRRAQGEELETPFELPDILYTDRQKVMKSSGRSAGRVEDHPEIFLLPFTPTDAPPKMLSKAHRGQVFYLSAEARAALKEEASPKNCTQPTDQTYISSNDALSALIWRAVMRAQYPLDKLEGNPTSVYNIALDGRLRTDPLVHPRTLGCFLTWVAASMPIRTMLESYNLADMAVAIRKALNPAGNLWVDDLTTIIERMEDVSRMAPTAFLDVPGYNCVQTSWINFALYDFSWGKLFSSKIEAVRSLDVGVINGGQVVLPILPDGGIEILIGVEESCLPRLLEDPLLKKYAQVR
ncbi:hypothetical protein DL771_005375 [Monosporascus sp. 5C6A]|nr:hypothetical protein DL771_005375 [Monosporascus sp. 5C6A]